jgi:hypothetical protein
MSIFYCLRFETLPTCKTRFPYLYPPGRGWPGYTPRHWVSFTSPTTTRRATMEVFVPPPHGMNLSLNFCFNCLPYNISARIAYKTAFIVVLQSFPWEHVSLLRRYSVTTAYIHLIRICCLAADVVCCLIHGNESTCYTAASLRLFGTNSLQAYRYFFVLEGCACAVCDRPSFPSTLLGSHGDNSPTDPAAPSLRPLVPSASLTRCEPVQVYYHHPRPRIRLDPVYHIIYPGDYLVRALSWGLEIGRFPLRAGWAIESHFFVLVVARTAGKSVVTSFHPVTGQLQVLEGILV